jgi:hypothetical protein
MSDKPARRYTFAIGPLLLPIYASSADAAAKECARLLGKPTILSMWDLFEYTNNKGVIATIHRDGTLIASNGIAD